MVTVAYSAPLVKLLTSDLLLSLFAAYSNWMGSYDLQRVMSRYAWATPAKSVIRVVSILYIDI